MQCAVRFSDDVPRVGVLVSREAHCLVDLLARSRRGELPVEIPVVICNHPDHAEVAEWFGVEFVHLPVTPDTKPSRSARCRRCWSATASTLVVLARYMQILSAEFVDAWPIGDHQHPPLVPARVHGRDARTTRRTTAG